LESNESNTPANDYASIQNPMFEDGLFGEESQPRAANEDVKTQRIPINFSYIAPMDMPSALSHFDGDKDFLTEMFTVFMTGLPDRLSEMQTAIDGNNANKLARLAHNLKGTSLNFSTEPLATLSAELEEMGKRDEIQFVASLVNQMQEEVHRLQEFVASRQLI